MPTEGERLLLVEQWRATIDARLWGDGGAVAYERSIEGRLSAVESALHAADALANAARELRRAEQHRWTKREKIIALVFGALTSLGGLAVMVSAVAQLF